MEMPIRILLLERLAVAVWSARTQRARARRMLMSALTKAAGRRLS